MHGPAAAKALSPRTFEPPAMIRTMQPAMHSEKSAEGMRDKRSAEGMCDMKSARGCATRSPPRGYTTRRRPWWCQHRFVAMNEGLARDVLTRDQSQREENKTDRKKKLPRHEALSPSECAKDSMGVDIAEYPVFFLPALSTWYGTVNEDPASQL